MNKEEKSYNQILDKKEMSKEEAEENENKYDDYTTAYMQGFYDGKNKFRDKIKEIIEKHKKFLSNESSKYDEDDIENRKAIQYASARLSFLLADIYKLGE